jgi:hypothetical protein
MTVNINIEGDLTSPLGVVLNQAYQMTNQVTSNLSDFVLNMQGMSGKKYRTLVNQLVKYTADARYLEIGSYKGSTACAAMYQNKVKTLCIDNFSFEGGLDKQELLNNVNLIMNNNIDFNLIDNDFRNIDYSSIGKFNIYMYDGPHAQRDQYDGVKLAQPALDDVFVLIVDDWNGLEVQKGTFQAIQDLGLKILTKLEVTTYGETITDQDSDWHFGYLIAVISK